MPCHSTGRQDAWLRWNGIALAAGRPVEFPGGPAEPPIHANRENTCSQQGQQDLPVGLSTPSRWKTGEIARQSSGAVVVRLEDTVSSPPWSPRPGQSRAGLLPADRRLHREDLRRRQDPGSFFKREGRPSELETLTSRLIDRPLRPLFPDGFFQ